ncbi:ATP-binding protein, partial [Streptomyces sp. NPDC002514]
MSRAGADHDLVGRARETKKLRQLLTVHRMVSVTGHAGVGKSRLAHAVAVVTADGPWRRIVHVRGTRTGPLSPGALASAVVRALGGPGAASGRGAGHEEAERGEGQGAEPVVGA